MLYERTAISRRLGGAGQTRVRGPAGGGPHDTGFKRINPGMNIEVDLAQEYEMAVRLAKDVLSQSRK